MTITTGPPIAARPTVRAWASLHCFVNWAPSDVDSFLVAVVGPTLGALRSTGLIEDWFFIRYAEGGPHLRIRVRGASDETVDALAARLHRAIRHAEYETQDPRRHGEVLPVPYEPEVQRYGGGHAIRVAEDVFCRSTELALQLLARVPDRSRRLTAVLDLWAATAAALDLDEHETVRWLATTGPSWRWHGIDGLLPAATVHNAAQQAAATQAVTVARRWAAVRAAVGTAGTGGPAGIVEVLRWADVVRRARVVLEADGDVPRARWIGVWSSQLHMLCNRLGAVPDEERATSALAAACLRAPDGPGRFFDDAAGAADRRYLAASRYAAGRMDEQNPRHAPPPERVTYPYPPGLPVTALPPARALPAGLADALAARASGRGDLGGTVTAADVSTLLSGAQASSPRPDPHSLSGPMRRPYPSAGARYVARLRLAALRVEGVRRGLYDVDHDVAGAPVLRPAGPAPAVADLISASMWLVDGTGAGPVADGRIDVSTIPAVLALYVRLDVLRAAYGQRALRFALLEAGHLAQNLALVAAATGLALTTVGAFYDDVAHEVLLLDGVDDVLVYLLPLGRAR